MKNEFDGMSAGQWEAALSAGEVAVDVNDSVVASVQGERSVLLDYSRGEYLGLDGVATFAWTLLREGRSFVEIVEAITREYDVSATTARSDVATLLSDLRRRGVVRIRKQAP